MTNSTAKRRKGIILAGGTGSRLYPLTQSVNKHLLPVYDKPMVHYPLTTLMLAGIRDIIIVSSPHGLPQLRDALGDGSQWGLSIEYAEQPRPEGIAQAFLVAAHLIEDSPVALVLGDNIFYGAHFPEQLRSVEKQKTGATVFASFVTRPEQFCVIELDNEEKPVALEEKPVTPRSNWAVPGLYFYGSDVVKMAEAITPSKRGELEITDLNRKYLEQGQLHVELMGRGIAWFDGGTHADLYAANQFVQVIEARLGMKIACPEEVAFRMGYISQDQLLSLVAAMPDGEHASYLRELTLRTYDHPKVT